MFGIGSLMAVVGQGFAVGGLLGGIAIVDGKFAGGMFDWFSPLTFFMTFGIIGSYATLGYAYLIQKTDYQMARQSFRRVVVSTVVALVAFLAAASMLPMSHYIFFTRWTVEPTRSILFAIGGAIAVLALLLAHDAIRKRHGGHLFLYCMAMFGLALFGLLVGTFPYIIPPTVSIYQAASSPSTLTFMLYGMGPLIPIVFAYNIYLYKVFSKARLNEHDDVYGV